MPAKSKKKADGAKPIDRPFDPPIFRRARRIAEKYQVILQFEDGEWYGRGLELPNAFGDGKTPDACVKMTREAFAAVVATMIEDGHKPPLPASDALRDQQVNVRLTTEEKARLEESSQQAGFRGVSDYVRFRALDPRAVSKRG
jgi:predicted RNase H-like HicB family nuclease